MKTNSVYSRLLAPASVVLSLVVSACALSSEPEDQDVSGAALTENWVARGVSVYSFENRVPNIPLVGKRYQANASLYALAPDSLPEKKYRGAIVVNPGAVVASTDMQTFAEALARKGYIAYVANNPVGDVDEKNGGPASGPIPLLVGNMLPTLSAALAKSPSAVKGLPPAIVKTHETWNRQGAPKLFGIGHSLGGAVLGTAAGRSDTGLSKIVLVGTDELVDAGFPFGITPPAAGPTPVKLIFLRGELDGLADATKTRALAAKYPNSQTLPDVKGANHFCIIDRNPGDPKQGKVGAPGKRAKDNVATLPTVQACVDASVSAIVKALES